MLKHVAFALLILTACVQRPAPVASDTQNVPPDEKLAIAVEYVAVPSLTVTAFDSNDSRSFQAATV